MELPSKEIVPAHTHTVCGFYAVINLFKLRGLRPPGYEQLAASFLTNMKTGTIALSRRANYSVHRGVSEVDIVMMLTSFEFPALCGMAAIPKKQTPRKVFTSLIEAGCHLIVGFKYCHPQLGAIDHAVVVEGFDERGMFVLDSGLGHEDWSVIELEPADCQQELQEYTKNHLHGSRRILPFYDTPTAQRPLGISPFFVIAYPE